MIALRDVLLQSPLPNAWESITLTHPDVVARVAQCEMELGKYQADDGPLTRPSMIMNVPCAKT